MEQGELLLFVGLHLVLTALPGVAAVLVAARRGVGRVPVLLGVGLAATGIVAMLAFWSYYGGRELGETFSFLVLFGSVMAAGFSLYGGRIGRSLLRQLSTPLALWVLGSVFLVFLGFLHGGNHTPIEMSGTRFTGVMPNDNDLPHYFANFFFENGHHGTAASPEWQASDRPPLQIGYVLSQRPLEWGNEGLHYQVLGVILQQLWIVGLWALLLAARVGRVTRALAIVTILVSDVAIVNGFYVWPKMLPAAMLLAAAALVVTPLWSELRRSLWAAALVGALLGLAMMGHGSSVFGIIPIALIAAYRGLPGWRWVAVSLLVGVAIVGPWSAYQKYGDPPGNRLTKWMLAGVPEVDDRGTTEAIIDSYREAGVGGTLHNKAENFVTMAGGGPAVEATESAVDAAEAGDSSQALRWLRIILFYCLLPSLGLLLAAPVVMALARRRGRRNPLEWNFALTCFGILVVGAITWGLILFGNLPARAVMHAGSFALPVLGLCGGVAALRATFPRFAIYYIGLSALLMLAIYVPAVDPMPGTGYSPLAAILAAAGLAGFCALALRGDGVRQKAPTGVGSSFPDHLPLRPGVRGRGDR
jgi:hypothetical protein